MEVNDKKLSAKVFFSSLLALCGLLFLMVLYRIIIFSMTGNIFEAPLKTFIVLLEYVQIQKEFLNKKPHTMLALTTEGRKAFEIYRANMKQMLEKLPT